MSKDIAVAAAIGAQLHHEGHWPPNDLNKVMGADYGYTKKTMPGFLEAVQWNLAHGGAPGYTFAVDAAFIAAALNWSVATLIGKAIAKTT